MQGYLGVPDIVGQRRMATSQNQVKLALERAQLELVEGEKTDRVAATDGDTSRLMGLDRSIAEIEARAPRLETARMRAATTQTAFDVMRDAIGDLGVSLLDPTIMRAPTAPEQRARQAEEALKQVMSTLNTTVSGRSLFGGAQGGGPAVGAAEDVIAAVLAGLDSDPDPAVALAAVDDFFGAAATTLNGIVFDGDVYLGAATDAPEVELATGERIAVQARADDDAIRALIKGLALAAALPSSIHAGDALARLSVQSAAGTALVNGDTDLVQVQAEVGAAELRVEGTLARGQAERTTLSISRNNLIGKDQYEAATEVSELETQLQAIYAITARMADLSFVNFFR